jgi:hypothetical protein
MAWFEILLMLIVGSFSERSPGTGTSYLYAADDGGPEIDPDG